LNFNGDDIFCPLLEHSLEETEAKRDFSNNPFSIVNQHGYCLDAIFLTKSILKTKAFPAKKYLLETKNVD
jgi:hypothetical protein